MSPTLLLVDVQKNMLQAPEPVPSSAEVGAALAGLLTAARGVGAPVVHVRNTGGDDDPDKPGTPGWELVHEVRAGEHVVDKDHCDAFDGTNLGELIDGTAELVVAGMQSEYCIRETTLAALRRGHRVTLVSGAHATYDDEQPAAEISRRVEDELRAAGATVVDVGEVRFGS